MELENEKAQLERIFKEHEKFIVQMEVQTKQLQLLKDMYGSAQMEHEKVVEDQKSQIEVLQQIVIELETQLKAKQASELEMMENMRDGSQALVTLQRRTNDELHVLGRTLLLWNMLVTSVMQQTFLPLNWKLCIMRGKFRKDRKSTARMKNKGMTKKYSRNFLLKFAERCNELPEGFDITSDVTEELVASKITDEEQAKQRQFKDILNRLTPHNFDELFEQFRQLNIGNVETLSGLVGQIYDKAIMEPFFSEMYANLCYHLHCELPDFSEDNETITFKGLLLNKCQKEFERKEKEQEEANRAEEVDEVKQTEEQIMGKIIKSQRRMGNVRLIGELYKKRMLHERIIHECIKKLLGEYQNPDEEDIEALCTLMNTIGKMINHSNEKHRMDDYFEMIYILSDSMKLSSRVRSMLKKLINLRNNRWQKRRKVRRKQ